ncbi:hypothetical protein [Actinoplanes utahensis]|uniref:hypothetical protein n=1 Tax=Actinoplanes utahensis TaxID=1869 RepID=UPI001A4BAA50|nr:hypothetical protein [Actinoplanes utahensis]GIF35493.1 hypothetical protein Aut01nite_84790 [Actinoplanes utahensis]
MSTAPRPPEPVDPWATIDRPAATVNLDGPTAYLGDPGRTVHLGPDQGATTVRTQQEVRFGPGVPVAPPAAPTWSTPTPARRPLWRRVTSLVSGLLTLALVGVVGFILWQRLSPLEVEGVTIAVPRPAGDRCDVSVDVVATVRTNGRSGAIRYQWLRSDALPSAVLTERVPRGQNTATLTLNWSFNGVGTATETATVNIVEPSAIQAGTEVVYRCGRG